MIQNADPLIRTKLRLPFIRPGLVSRPRLQEQITRGLCGPLTLITAPAGFGKTTLVASGVAGCGIPVAWLSVDKNDNQAGRFLRYLMAAIREADPAAGSEATELLASQATFEAVLTSLINDLDASSREMALVLDDYQLITSPAVHEVVGFLLEHRPSTLHLLIATRSDPPLPLARLRARGQTVELRAADLRFTESEAIQFLGDVMGLHLDASAVAVLEERTEGWIAGLQMASIALQSYLSTHDREDVDRFIQTFAGTNRFIMDFMLEEVLAREPEEVQDFLLQTSVLNRLSGPLCDAVTGSAGSQEMLERLERRNLFVVPLDDDRRWYRYHHLFSDLLQAKLYQPGPDRAAHLLSRAAGWCERDGQVVEAVSYAIAAQDYVLAAGMIEKYWQPIVNNGEIEMVWSWLNALPEDIVRDSAPLNIIFCMVLWLAGQVGAIEAHLADAERALGKLKGSQGPGWSASEYVILPAVLAALRSFVARYNEAFETASALAEQALSLVPDHLPTQEDGQLRGLVFLALASACDGVGDLEKAVYAYAETIRWSRIAANTTGVTGITFRMIGALRLLGRLRAADAAGRDALAYIQAQGMDRLPAAGVLHVAMSEVLVERNELEAAEAHLAQGIELGRWSGRLDAAKNAAYAQSRLRLARQDLDSALAAVRDAEEALGETIPPLAKAELLAIKARILVQQGSLREAAQCIEEAARLTGHEQGQTCEIVSLAAARVMQAQCAPGEAAAQLAYSIAAAEGRGRSGAAIELRILRSLALASQGDTQGAEAELEKVLTMTEPEGYVRIFLDEGQPMQALIAQWLAHVKPSPLRNYAARLLAQFEAEPDRAADGQAKATPAVRTFEPEASSANSKLVEPLSQRELEVLHLMALGKTNQEIARQLIVAPGTIKAHAASIYRKLDAANRTEAVARARQMGILP